MQQTNCSLTNTEMNKHQTHLYKQPHLLQLTNLLIEGANVLLNNVR